MLIAFFTNEDKGITSIIDTIGGILSGFEVPLLLLPPVILKISNYLPFRYIIYVNQMNICLSPSIYSI